jgi:hypothetical protein
MPLLVAFLGAPIVWAVHLAASYLLVALDCGSGWDGARTAVLVATAVCAVAAVSTGAFGWHQWKRGAGRLGDSMLDPIDVREFLLLGGVILAVLFAGAIVFAGIAPLFLPVCG